MRKLLKQLQDNRKLLDRMYNMCLDNIYKAWIAKSLPPFKMKDELRGRKIIPGNKALKEHDKPTNT